MTCVGSRNLRFCTPELSLLLEAKARFHSSCLGYAMEERMSEGGSMGRSGGRSGNRLCATGIPQGCTLWVDPQIGLPARTGSTRIMVSPPFSVCHLSLRWIDQPGLVLLMWEEQRMRGSCERGTVTGRRFFYVICISGSALRAPWWPYRKINERNTRSMAKGRCRSCRYL